MDATGTDDVTKSRCIASDCMAWRGHLTAKVEEQMYHDVAAGKEPQREGFCGLAGKTS